MNSRTSNPIFCWVRVLTIVLILSTSISGVLAAGPGITPSTVEQLINPGESVDIAKTVTTPEILPKPDIYFLADNTGSMGPAIANVVNNATTILNTVKGSTNDPRFGAGFYRDFPFDLPTFVNQAPIQAIDDGGAAAVNAINAWTAAGGNDEAEGQFFALDQLADPINWRTDSSKIIVWFGDSAGHDPICSAISGLAYDIDEASVKTKLATQKIRVIAIGVVGTNSPIPDGLNGDPTGFSGDYVGICPTIDGSAGQPQRIAADTQGIYLSNVLPEDVSNAILTGLTALNVEVSMASDCTAPVGTSFNPVTQTVTSGLDAGFTETISVATGTAGGTYTCKDWALINGQPMMDANGAIIYEQKTIHVPGIDLQPKTDTNELMPNATHTVVATLTAGNYGPVAGVPIEFSILSGPNTGKTGSGISDVNGQASFTYSLGATVNPTNLGTDTIQASFTNADGSVVYGSATATKTWVDTTPPVTACDQTVNPAGRRIPAAPGQGGQGQNQDGFYQLNATDIVWPASGIQMFVTDSGSGTIFGPFPVGTNIKYTEAPGVIPFQKPMSGAVAWHIFGQGDAVLTATDGSGNISTGVTCLVPPPPK